MAPRAAFFKNLKRSKNAKTPTASNCSYDSVNDIML